MRDVHDPSRWWGRAMQDREGARHLYTENPSGLAALICSLAQQACEKMLKAYLLAKGTIPQRTHALRALALDVQETLPAIGSILPDLAELGTYEVTSRYPTEFAGDFTASMAQQSLICVEQLYELLEREVSY